MLQQEDCVEEKVPVKPVLLTCLFTKPGLTPSQDSEAAWKALQLLGVVSWRAKSQSLTCTGLFSAASCCLPNTMNKTVEAWTTSCLPVSQTTNTHSVLLAGIALAPRGPGREHTVAGLREAAHRPGMSVVGHALVGVAGVKRLLFTTAFNKWASGCETTELWGQSQVAYPYATLHA